MLVIFVRLQRVPFVGRGVAGGEDAVEEVTCGVRASLCQYRSGWMGLFVWKENSF